MLADRQGHDVAAADVMQPPSHVIENFRRRPGPAAAARDSGVRLEALIRSRIIPELASRYGLGAAPVHPRAAELAGLLLKDAVGPVETLLEQAASHTGSLPSLRIALLEPAARLLGDRWLDDTCTEADVFLGLCLLQSAVRRSAGGRMHRRACGSPGRVLVALLPGETHSLGVSLASETLHASGWDVTVAFPADIGALVAQLRSERSDALHLTLSDAFRREECLPSLRRAVRKARSTSLDRSLRITVGGRMFAESVTRPGAIGADALLPMAHAHV